MRIILKKQQQQLSGWVSPLEPVLYKTTLILCMSLSASVYSSAKWDNMFPLYAIIVGIKQINIYEALSIVPGK